MNNEKVSTQKIVVTIIAGIAAALVVGLLCHLVGLNARGWAVLPLATGGGAVYFVLKKSGIQ